MRERGHEADGTMCDAGGALTARCEFPEGGLFEFRLRQDADQILARMGKAAGANVAERPAKILLRVFFANVCYPCLRCETR